MFFRNAQLEDIRNVVGRVGCGVHKRVDENRELLELLRERAPELLYDCPWVESWLKSHDDFFVELEKVAGVENPFGPHVKFPRPWPTAQKIERKQG